MSLPRLIALTGLAGSGKSTVAGILSEGFGYRRTRFAGPLKSMLRSLFASAGLDSVQIERRIEGDLKEMPDDLICRKTPRFAMQTLGTEWRELIGTDLWTGIWRAGAADGLCTVEDCRFEHEYQAVKDMGGIVVHIHRGAGIGSTHASENGLPGHCPADYVIINDASIADLHIAVRRMLYTLEVPDAA